jgi:hypothetical protein
MCGRFARFSLSRELEQFFNVHPPAFEILANYNVAPTQEIPLSIICSKFWESNTGIRLDEGKLETCLSTGLEGRSGETKGTPPLGAGATHLTG